jgi:hypothetical protein
MTDIKLVVAELRAADLLVALQAAVSGDSHWQQKAAWLLADIEALRLPAPAFEKLREIDGRKRAAEILHDKLADAFAQQCASEDVCHGA